MIFPRGRPFNIQRGKGFNVRIIYFFKLHNKSNNVFSRFAQSFYCFLTFYTYKYGPDSEQFFFTFFPKLPYSLLAIKWSAPSPCTLFSYKLIMLLCCSSALAGGLRRQLCGIFRSNFPLKINHSCIGIKLCDSATPLKVRYVYRPGKCFGVQ